MEDAGAPRLQSPTSMETTSRPVAQAQVEDLGEGENSPEEIDRAGDVATAAPSDVARFSSTPRCRRIRRRRRLRSPRRRRVPSDAESAAGRRSDGDKLRASPLARRAAEEAGVDLAHVRGTGPDGRVTKRDIDNFLREQQLFHFRRLVAPREGAPGTREELSTMRKTIAKRMAQSKREIPHFYVTVEVDMEEAVKLKNSLEATELFEETVTYNDIIVKATALALGRYTRMNASYEDDGIVIYPNINIGVAVAVEDGLIVPVIHDCERLSLLEISAARIAWSARPRAAASPPTNCPARPSRSRTWGCSVSSTLRP